MAEESWKNLPIMAGVSSIGPADRYHWDGMKRGGELSAPSWLFQYTRKGWGVFRSRKGKWKVGPGQAFFALIPSQHVYHQDPGCPEWEFSWVVVRHPYAVSRLARHANLVNTVGEFPLDSIAVSGARKMGEMWERASYVDPYVVEAELFVWMIDIERRAFFKRHPNEARERLLAFCRDHVVTHLSRPLKVEELARETGMNRSNFSHHFRKVAGITPAAFAHHVRLDEAAKLLCEQRWSVKEVASMTGFSDANHLCKSFRKRFDISPAVYKRLTSVTRL